MLGILALLFLACLFLVPLGLPGTWLMLAVAFGYDLLAEGADPIGIWHIAGAALLALGAELVEFTLAGRYTRQYGGSRRAGWGAILGGIAGAMIGFPIFLIGPMIGAFAGAFAGALLLEYLGARDAKAATRVAWGALVGRVVAAAMKVGVGFVMAVWLLVAAWR